jgi:hypothetical protein
MTLMILQFQADNIGAPIDLVDVRNRIVEKTSVPVNIAVHLDANGAWYFYLSADADGWSETYSFDLEILQDADEFGPIGDFIEHDVDWSNPSDDIVRLVCDRIASMKMRRERQKRDEEERAKRLAEERKRTDEELRVAVRAKMQDPASVNLERLMATVLAGYKIRVNSLTFEDIGVPHTILVRVGGDFPHAETVAIRYASENFVRESPDVITGTLVAAIGRELQNAGKAPSEGVTHQVRVVRV